MYETSDQRGLLEGTGYNKISKTQWNSGDVGEAFLRPVKNNNYFQKVKYLADIILLLIYVEPMVTVAEITLWISLLIVFYTYAGYPFLLLILVSTKKIFWKSTVYENKSPDLPSVTLIVAAYNEENILSEKIRNSLQIDYPEEKLNIIFVTDGSTDNSNLIINQYPGIKLLHTTERRGKVAAINRVMASVNTEIVVFSDANTQLNSSCIHNIIRHFQNTRVGGVAGEKKIFKEEGVAGGEGVYWKYESALKKLDSQLYTVVGAAGELFSVRTPLYTPLPENIILDDFVQSLLLCQKGYIVKYEPDAFATERASFSLADEKERKIRISAGGFQAMVRLKELFNFFHYGVLSFQYISHRVLRWTLCPIALVFALLSSFYLYIKQGTLLYGIVTGLQTLFYLAAFAGYFVPWRLFYLPFYFCLMNYCVFAGFLRYLSGRQQATWQKAFRTESKK